MSQTIRKAHTIDVKLCANPACGAPHIFLLDEHDEPFAVAVINDAAAFVRALQDLLYEAATRKDQ